MGRATNRGWLHTSTLPRTRSSSAGRSHTSAPWSCVGGDARAHLPPPRTDGQPPGASSHRRLPGHTAGGEKKERSPAVPGEGCEDSRVGLRLPMLFHLARVRHRPPSVPPCLPAAPHPFALSAPPRLFFPLLASPARLPGPKVACGSLLHEIQCARTACRKARRGTKIVVVVLVVSTGEGELLSSTSIRSPTWINRRHRTLHARHTRAHVVHCPLGLEIPAATGKAQLQGHQRVGIVRCKTETVDERCRNCQSEGRLGTAQKGVRRTTFEVPLSRPCDMHKTKEGESHMARRFLHSAGTKVRGMSTN
ncbi:hypothetical protein C8R45DRAFT_988455 [Mycena sanguinolenta]|nr:hypothetical protein C8R45DRAFT_988455 [Mycena sanguinolenta]